MRGCVVVLALSVAVGCGSAPESKRLVETPKEKDKEKPQPPKPKPKDKPVELSPPTKTRAEQFAEAWEKAEKVGAALDKEEPAASEKAMKLLSDREKIEVGNLMFNPANLLDKNAVVLVRLGLSAWVARESRRIAAADDGFRGTVSVLWDVDRGAQGILGMMNTWGAVPRTTRHLLKEHVATGTATEKLPAEVRAALQNLGAEKWLLRGTD